MKTPSTMLNEIKSLLGLELSAETEEVKAEEVKVELAQAKLENGTVIEAEEFAPESEVFIVTEDERVALPVGEYTLEDGKILVVEEEGIIKEIAEATEEEPEAEVEAEVEAAEEEVPAEEMSYVSKEEFSAAIDEIKAMIDEIQASYKEKEEMEAQVKEELSATPAAEPIKHSPESSEEFKLKFKIAPKRAASTRDRIAEAYSKIKNQ